MKKIVFLTGAGISVESGFKTFRGEDGLWEDQPVERVATHEAVMRDPVFVNKFYNGLRRKLFAAQPNAAHKAVAELEAWFHVDVVTQNVDDLHERAGSSHVLHLHGELTKSTSSIDPYNPAMVEELTTASPDILPGEKAADGSLKRPYIVFFGESVPMMEQAAETMAEADIAVVVGTSLVVYPAAGLLRHLRPGTPVYIVDPSPIRAPHGCHAVQILKGAVEGMAELKGILENLR